MRTAIPVYFTLTYFTLHMGTGSWLTITVSTSAVFKSNKYEYSKEYIPNDIYNQVYRNNKKQNIKRENQATVKFQHGLESNRKRSHLLLADTSMQPLKISKSETKTVYFDNTVRLQAW